MHFVSEAVGRSSPASSGFKSSLFGSGGSEGCRDEEWLGDCSREASCVGLALLDGVPGLGGASRGTLDARGGMADWSSPTVDLTSGPVTSAVAGAALPEAGGVLGAGGTGDFVRLRLRLRRASSPLCERERRGERERREEYER